MNKNKLQGVGNHRVATDFSPCPTATSQCMKSFLAGYNRCFFKLHAVQFVVVPFLLQ